MARRPTPPGTPTPSGIRHFVELAKSTIPPLHPAGLPFVAAPLAIAALGRRHPWIRRIGLTTAAANAAFFRHPHRVPPHRPGIVVAPADGEIALVDKAAPPTELGLGTEPLPRVSIFLSVFDVHVQRVPAAGTVRSVVHQRGQFRSADLPEASDVNERNSVVIDTPEGKQVVVVQIAGLVARRIVCDAKPGDVLTLGDTYGLIRFGSRLDTYFPAGTQLLVQRGQRAVGAETVLADLSAS
ncbi:phosphatidylserine decarboxylase [Aldersonia sp. NBC_00410]|uniref:phosphatidylserine decarboxylase n=1 Tax=Aldersonia sp. NBC_00410 TaxID=2975954 RepID=UPI00224D22D0|nr:phosphatidylserine decarboxylase [Aldersonia sp. NBC_00410]MCX5041911.1 phosphatidylserine decarboxylase [Aldersonia sp. NBC_00410]